MYRHKSILIKPTNILANWQALLEKGYIYNNRIKRFHVNYFASASQIIVIVNNAE